MMSLLARPEPLEAFTTFSFELSYDGGRESYSAQLQDGFPRVHQNVFLRLSMT
jgi:hypothetical protein